MRASLAAVLFSAVAITACSESIAQPNTLDVFREGITVGAKECYLWEDSAFSDGYLTLEAMSNEQVEGEIAFHFHGPDFVITRFTSHSLRKFSHIEVVNIRPNRTDIGNIFLTKHRGNIVLLSDSYLTQPMIFVPVSCEEADKWHKAIEGLMNQHPEMP